jgi:TolB-like protein/Flp pilus assembly protein TadD
MASILPGFEYDIFVSYRHKDNKYDGWVTEFVANLKREIGATFKEDISIYFDSNTYDGLLETYQVDKSLEAKLKSIVFIPVISQTYCDTKSFAWQHEFCVFNRLAKANEIGRDIRLGNGNVASRILPVKIHDLDGEDNATLETELGGPLRAVEFIFKSAGVNRPLRVEDKREDNLNRLFYRDQINKVANAVKEITNGIRFPGRKEKAETTKTALSPDSIPERNSKSIAVLPFVNLSQDVSQEYFADGITENILIQLAGLKQLRVISRTSIMRYKKTTKSAPEIAIELGVTYILEGSAQMHGNKVRIQVQLIDAMTDDHLWSKAFVESIEDIFSIQNSVAETVAKELLTSLAPKENDQLKSVPTKNLEAYDLFLKGRHAFNQWGVEGYRSATEYFKQAIAKDPDFKEAYSYLASSYSARMSWNGDLSPAAAQQNIELYLGEAWRRGPTDNDYLTKAFVEFFIRKDFSAAEKSFLTAIELNANSASALYTYSYLLNMMGRFDEAAQWLSKAKLIDPLTVGYFNFQTISLHLTNKNEEAVNTIKEGIKLYPSVLRFYDFLARIYLTLGKSAEAEEAILTGFRMSTVRPPSMVAFLAIATAALGKKEKSLELLNELVNRSNANEMGVNINIVYIFSAFHDFSAGLQWLEKAKQTNDVGLIWWQVDPLFKYLRDHVNESKSLASADYSRAEKHIVALLEAGMPRLPYHNINHVHDVLNSSVAIAKQEGLNEGEIKLLRVAALLHDIGFVHSPANHEERGAQMAREILPPFGFTNDQIEVIEKMILATRLPQSPATHLEKVLCDADLDYLGREDFYEIGNKLLEELKATGIVETEREWNIMQKTFLEGHRYHTKFSKKNREGKKQERREEIGAKLRSK